MRHIVPLLTTLAFSCPSRGHSSDPHTQGVTAAETLPSCEKAEKKDRTCVKGVKKKRRWRRVRKGEGKGVEAKKGEKNWKEEGEGKE
ncbi:hypothetical protein E2C01_044868 [Portunus trituberculatus]|uniref:Uncharacterized protein n=1 Tax=Portunus trituberculatus TaxID=210409 RepID=A0A5B7FU72_PORTR|nr:hypothetical protein [Portunus trituberculatus]